VGGDHAIEVMAIGIEWAVPLDETCLRALEDVYMNSADLKEVFPLFVPTQAFTIQTVQQIGATSPDSPLPVEARNIVPPQFTAKPAGFNASRMGTGEKILWAVSARPEFLSYNCLAYARWRNVNPKALMALQPFVDKVLGIGAQINAIGLQYQDAFRLLDGASPETTKQLFRSDSRWLPSHLFDEPSFWHCNQGWFSKGPDSRRVLNNVATDVADINGVHFARIGGQHRIFAISVDGKTPNRIDTGDIEAILDSLHVENKNLIRGMLSDGALAAIGFSAGDARP
jgi:uncharacterized protein (TIGR04255 family)